MKKLFFLPIFAAILLSGCGQNTATPSTPPPSTEKDIIIGFSLSDLRVERWQRDRDFFLTKADSLGASVMVVSADLDADTQESQVENLLLQGIDVLVILAQDGEKAAKIVEMAHSYDVPVISYDRLIKNSSPDYYITFDNKKVGELQAAGVLEKVSSGNFAYIGGSPTDSNSQWLKEGAMKVLQPGIDSGDINIVFDEFTEGWKTEVAYENLKKYLNENDGNIDAVIAANDATARGAIHALEEIGLAGKIPVSGQDASLGACQLIAEGKQTVSVYKPIKAIAEMAAEMAISAANDEAVVTNGTINNGTSDIPSFLLDVQIVTQETLMDTVIKDDFHSYDNVYQNIPKNERPAKQ